jgi:serine/threonine protein kinase
MNPPFQFYLSKSGEKYSAKADLWSVGSVLFEMVAGVTPFHGENHLDLLRNIKTKAVRLPATVRVSREFVNLLKLLLDRKPHNRADFTTFFEASEALVALGCNGTPAVPPSSIEKNTSTQISTLLSSGSGQRIVERDVCVQMNLCAISENEGTVESHHQENASLSTVATSESANSNQVHQPQTLGNNVSNEMNVMVHVRPDHMNKQGVVTPPFNPVAATQPPPALTYGLSGAGRQYGARPSIFAPLQGSPNLSPYTPKAAVPNPPMFLLGGVSNDAFPRPISHSQPKPVVNQVIQQQRMIGHPTYVNSADRKNSSSKISCHESSDSEFVMVEHSGWQSKPGSGRNSPSTSIGGIVHSVSCSPHNSSSRVTILDARKNMGMLGTSPGTGRALFGKMMMGSMAQSTLAPATTSEGGRFDLSPRSALFNGGCLAHIDVLVRMLSASEDIGRRAITVAHLGDMRAYLGMGLLVTLKEESQLSSMSTGTSMEGVDDERSTDICNTKRIPFGKSVPEEGDDDDEEEELPFAMTTSSDGGSGEKISDPSTQNVNIAKSSEHIKTRGESTSLPMIHLHFREALMCYFKALTMMKVSISAAQKVAKESDEVLHQSLSVNIATIDKNPYTPLKNRCSASLEWLSGQFSAVLERADAASDQISKLQKASSSRLDGGEESQVCVEELIYNHSLKCGREGAVKQILGHYDEARSCFRSAGLLAETLLMESKVGEEDRIVLEGYVNSFADQIITLDGLIRVEMMKSRGAVSLLQSQENRGGATSGSRPLRGYDQKN